jgi:hypothetical protein
MTRRVFGSRTVNSMNDFSILRIIAAIGLVTLSCALFTSLQGCGHGEPLAAAPSGVHSELAPATGLAHAQHLTHDAQVVCADSHGCPAGVGMVVAAFEDGVLRCTGALVGPDLLLTSGRCIPQDLGADCGERIRFLLPEAGSARAQEARCAQVLSAGSEASSSYAFVRLAGPVSGREPLRMETGGLASGAAFSVPVVNPTSDTQAFGEIRLLSCKAIQKSAIFPAFRSDLSPVAALGSCLAGASALGAPVLDASGSVRAVVQGMALPREIQLDQVVYAPMLHDTQVSDFVYASSLACIQVPGAAARDLPAACAQDKGAPAPAASLSLALTPEALSGAQATLSSQVWQWQSSSSPAAGGGKVRWGVAPLAVSPIQSSSPVPSCFSGSAQWLGSYRHWYIRGGYPSDAELDIQRPSYQVELDLNSFLQTLASVQVQGTSGLKLHFSPKDLAQSGQSTVTLTDRSTGASVGSALTVRNCAN